jgi:methylmalonyl-CoA mutase, C-terminal domain
MVRLSAPECLVGHFARTLTRLRRPAGTFNESRLKWELGKLRVNMAPDRKIRVLVAKPGLDGHDRGAKVIARALRDAGMEVIYTGLRQTPEMVVSASLQEDVDVIGLSILSGAHNAIVPRVMELMKQNQMDDVLVLVGGIIPDQDVDALKKGGVAAVFQPGTSMDSIIEFIRTNVKSRGVTANT